MDTHKKNINKIWFSDNYINKMADCDCACETQIEINIPKFENISVDKIKKNKFSKLKIDNNHYILWNNKLSNGINVVNSEMLQSINNKEKLQNKETLNLLLNRNLISLKQQVIKEKEPKIFSSWLHISNNCNLDCSYCYLKKSNENMSLETGLQSINSIFNTAIKNNIKELKLKFAGAEPLFNFPIAKKMQELALLLSEKHNIKLTSILLTNATLLTVDIISTLKKLQFKVMVSLDGIGKYHDYFRSFKNGKNSYDIVITNTEKLMQAGILSDISITVTDNNIEGLPDLVKLLLDKNYPFNINFYRENEKSVNENLTFSEKKIIKYMKETFKVIDNNLPNRSLLSSLLDRVDLSSTHNYTCGVGSNYAVIDQNGYLSKCQMQIGNNKTFSSIKSEDLLFDIKNDKTQIQNISIESKNDCQNCEIKNYCTGGCPLISKTNKSPNCNIYKALYKDILKLEAKRLMKYTTPHILN